MCCVELKGTEKVEILPVPSMNQLIMLKTLTACGTRIMVGKVNMHHTDGKHASPVMSPLLHLPQASFLPMMSQLFGGKNYLLKFSIRARYVYDAV